MSKLTKTLLILSMVVSAGVQAKDRPVTEACEAIRDTARSIMIDRMAEVPLTEMMRAAGGKELSEMIVLTAHERPLDAERPVEEFADHWYMLCYKANKNIALEE